MKTNQRTIEVYDRKGNFLGYEVFDIRYDKHDIAKLLNEKYP